MPRFLFPFFVPLALTALSIACDNSAQAPPADAQKVDDKKDAEAEAAVAKRRAEREAKDKAEAEAAATRQAAIEKVAVLPDKLPKDLVKACDAVADAQDAFVKRHMEGDFLEKWDGGLKGTQLPMTKVQCTQTNSLEVAACQKNALETAGPELKDAVGDLFRACIDKFAAGGPPPGGAMPPRPRGG